MPFQQQCSVPTENVCAAIESNEKTRLKTNGLEGLAKANGNANGKDQGDRKKATFTGKLWGMGNDDSVFVSLVFLFFDFYMCLRSILVVSSYLACFCSCYAKVLFLRVSSVIVGKGYYGTILVVCVATAGLFLAAFVFVCSSWLRKKPICF